MSAEVGPGCSPWCSNSMGTFDLETKRATLDARSEWRKSIFTLNAARRLRFTTDIENRQEYEKRRDEIRVRKRLKTSLTVAQAVIRFERAAELLKPERDSDELLKKAEEYGFQDGPKELARLVEQDDKKRLREVGGVKGLARRLKVEFEEGLPGDEKDIKQRQEIYGANTYPEKPPKGFWVFVWEALQDVTLLILLVCAVLSLVIGIPTEGWQEGWYDGAGIAFSIFLVVFVTAASDYQQSKQFRELDNEKKKIFLQVTRAGCRKQVLIFDLLVGDVVHLGIGDVVPADGVYVRGYSLTIDESSMTGESIPQYKNEKNPFLLSGTTVQDGSGLMLVTGVGMNTEWGKLMATLSDDTCEETPLQVRLNGVATLIGKVGLGFAVLTFVVLVIRFVINKAEKGHIKDWDLEDLVVLVDYFAIAVTIIVVAVPEGLPLAVTLTLAYAMKKMMADKALVRHLSACETMGSATTICSDKTGTLTTNKMTVARAWVAGSERDASEIKGQLPEEFLPILLQGVFQNTSGDVSQSDNSLIGTPTETACLGLGVCLGGNFKNVRAESEILKVEPFNSAKKKMGVVLRNPDGSLRVHWKGASEIVLASCDKVIDGEGEVVPIDDEMNKQLKGTIQSFADNALRTLCLAYKDVEDWQDGPIPDEGFTCAAILGIKDPVRPGVPEAVETCFSAGIKVRMVTGDNVNTAVAIAKECKILTDGVVIQGPEFRQLYGDPDTDKEYFKNLVKNLQVMARSSPTDKHILVKTLREMGEVVAVTGDGTNDAPALHEADIGLAMGIAGTEVAKESADVIILDDRFQTIVTQAKWGRAVYTNIQKFVQFQLTVNLVALVINFTSACVTGEAPLTAVQLLWVNLIMDTLGALALATEPPTDDLMTKAPVGRKGEFITYVMWRNIAGQVFYQLLVLFVLQYKYKDLSFLGINEGDKETLNTLIFNTFVFCQVFNEINSREMEKINVFRNTFNNIVFILVLVFTIVFQVIMVEFLGKFAETVPLNLKLWLFSVGIGAGSLVVAALVKLIPVPSPRRVPERPDKSHLTNGGAADGGPTEPLLRSDSAAEGAMV